MSDFLDEIGQDILIDQDPEPITDEGYDWDTWDRTEDDPE